VRFILQDVYAPILLQARNRATIKLVNMLKKPTFAGLALLFVAIIVGEQLNLYVLLPGIDKTFHFLGGVVCAWWAWQWLSQELQQPLHRSAAVLGIALAIGVVWEWAEYLSNFSRTIIPLLYHYFHGGDLVDTLGDLIADTAGALAFIAIRQTRY
jgi:uncharacterized membrane protein YjdF